MTWHVLRQKFTDSAFNFEAKLRPTLKSMNDCSNPQAPNTTIPHLLPCVLLYERNLEEIMGNKPLSYIQAGTGTKQVVIAECLSSDFKWLRESQSGKNILTSTANLIAAWVLRFIVTLIQQQNFILNFLNLETRNSSFGRTSLFQLNGISFM